MSIAIHLITKYLPKVMERTQNIYYIIVLIVLLTVSFLYVETALQ